MTLELLPAFFYCSNSVNLLHNSSGSDDENFVFEAPEAMLAGDLSNYIRVLSLLLFRLFCLTIKFISFSNS